MGTEPDPGSKSKIWRITGFGSGTGVLVFGARTDSESIFLTLYISAVQ